MSQKIEIMAPVGSWESLTAAISAGADSIYFGVQGLNMRSASSVNFSLDDLHTIVERCHRHGVKSYLTLNTVLYDQDLEYMNQVLDAAALSKVTAVIIADQSAMLAARRRGLEVHISTQVNISNIEAVEFYSQWADVVVLARELQLPQVRYIYDQIRERDIRGPLGELVRIEMFAHGALCMAVSGKCYLSLHEAWKSANRGSCRQICRRQYHVQDIETGAELEVDNKYILSPKDLSTIEFLGEMVNSGVRVLKIEGRARGAEYVKRVCESYRQALNLIEREEYTPEAAHEIYDRLCEVFNRGFWGGYYLGHKVGKEFGEWTSSYGSSATRTKVYIGRVTNFFNRINVAEIELQSGDLSVGDSLLITGETTGAAELICSEIRLPHGDGVDKALKGGKCSIPTGDIALRRGDKVYRW
ncbi:MAG: peptidase U32 family protein [Rikenellaceae bacterium]